MAKFIVKFDSDFHATADSMEAEIATHGCTVERTLAFDHTYLIDTGDQADPAAVIAAMAGVHSSEDAGKVVNAEMQAYTTTHLEMLDEAYTGTTGFTPKYTGAGQEVYLIDTGVQQSHPEFTGASINDLYSNFAGDFSDNAGHGTAVGSLIVGQNIGSAPNATLHNVRLFDAGSGDITVGEIIDALDAVLTNHNLTPTKAKVVCMPWTIPQNDFVDSRIAEMNQNNLVPVASAGNSGADVNTVSPAGVDNAITVGAFNNAYEVGSFTNVPFSSAGTYSNNYGAQLDIFAMGVDVSYASTTGDYGTGSGTSFAGGIVAGAVAALMEKYPDADALTIKDRMLSEGHTVGSRQLTFDSSSGVDYSAVYKSIALIDRQGQSSFATVESGRIANLQINTTQDINIGLVPNAVEVQQLDFAPLPDWIQFNETTGVISIDASVDPSLAPGVYIFAIKGVVDGNASVEEYSVGLYVESESELDDSVSSYYYDADTESYDEVVNYQVAPFDKF